MKVEFRNLANDAAYLELQPEHEADQMVLRKIYEAGFATGSGTFLEDQKKVAVFSHLYVALQKKPHP